MDFWVSLGMMLGIGAVAGWTASVILHGQGSGLLGNMVVGFLGAYIGHWMFDYLRLPPLSDWSYLGEFIYGVVGSMALLLVFGRMFIQQDNL
ncbi:MAG: GlsB/YeaQ/YmgE family stress response membrane protein [Caldilineaceae bacterium]|jgi:uncharacterized membrane protein YeaQ/YmgE (transglycosylase-associated protein family)|nr:GlsB/YeaQ/YmgE family stress response membrane protein [Caldilineaceae bacterium]